ncbi:centromere protein K [Procambarus clarkii]|uniref:centromere protein K n=1 Tax=Procambarus clarkii TaxID=6728 RepID=UPI001E677DE4|nr:uncharacterized protein LOC123757620 isoform X2 [Procambarus clarkii]
MATDSERIDTARVQAHVEDLVMKIQEEVEGLQVDVGESGESLARKAGGPLQEDVGIMLATKMHLQSEIEAMMQSGVVQLPEDTHLLLRMAKEEAEIMAITNARTLAAYKQKVMKLQERKRMYEEMLKKATLVNDKLDQLLVRQSEKDQLELVKRRFDRSAVVFRALRQELHTILSEFYPEDGDMMSMETLLERLISKMLEDQNEPYIDIDDTMKMNHVEFLVRANLITRHHKNISQIRFIDPRM